MRWSVSAVVVSALLMCAMVSVAAPITVEHLLSSGHGEAVRQATEAIAELFNASQDEIEVVVNVVSGGYNEPIIARIIAGTPPDVITTMRIPELLSVMAPLDAYAQADTVQQLFIPPALEQSTFEGHLVQLPTECSPLLSFYNVRLWEGAGLESPAVLYRAGRWDWDNIARAGQRIARDTNGDGILDIWGMNITGFSVERNHIFIHQAGGSLFDRFALPTQSRFNSSQVGYALQYIHDLIYEKRVMAASAATGWEGYGKFINGEVGVTFEGPWIIGQIRNAGVMSEGEWDIAPPPRGPANADTMTHTNGVQLVRESRNPEAAWKWMCFLTTDPQALQIMCGTTGRPSPVLRQLREYPRIAAPQGTPRNAQVVVDTLVQGGKPFVILSPKADELEQVFETELIKYFDGTQALKTTLETVDTHWNRILQEP